MDWFLCIVVFVSLSLFTLLRRTLTGGTLTGRCGECGYDLRGLRPESPCPECGSAKLERSNMVVRYQLDPPRTARWWPAVAMALAALALVSVLTKQLLFVSYLNDGFSVKQAQQAIPVRGNDDVGRALWPLLIALAFTPLSVLRPSLKRAAQAARLMVGAGLVVSTILVLLKTVGH